MSKQDGCAPRTAADLERKFSFGQTFAEQRSLISKAQRAANEANASLEKLDQKQLVNLLTKSGKTNAIYLDSEGNLCFNATFILTGVLGDERLPASIARMSAIPTLISQLENDSEYLDEEAVDKILIGTRFAWSNLPEDVAKASDIPTATSKLTNDSGFVTGEGVTTIANNAISASEIIRDLIARVEAIENASNG